MFLEVRSLVRFPPPMFCTSLFIAKFVSKITCVLSPSCSHSVALAPDNLDDEVATIGDCNGDTVLHVALPAQWNQCLCSGTTETAKGG